MSMMSLTALTERARAIPSMRAKGSAGRSHPDSDSEDGRRAPSTRRVTRKSELRAAETEGEENALEAGATGRKSGRGVKMAKREQQAGEGAAKARAVGKAAALRAEIERLEGKCSGWMSDEEDEFRRPDSIASEDSTSPEVLFLMRDGHDPLVVHQELMPRWEYNIGSHTRKDLRPQEPIFAFSSTVACGKHATIRFCPAATAAERARARTGGEGSSKDFQRFFLFHEKGQDEPAGADPDAVAIITDQSSKGTWVNGVRLSKDAPCFLYSGDRVTLGRRHASTGTASNSFVLQLGDDGAGPVQAEKKEGFLQGLGNRVKGWLGNRGVEAKPARGDTSDVDRSELELMRCSICLDILHNTVSALPCLHEACSHCAYAWLNNYAYTRDGDGPDEPPRECPVCKQAVTRWQPNHAKRELVRLFLTRHPEHRREDAGVCDRADQIPLDGLAMEDVGQERHVKFQALLTQLTRLANNESGLVRMDLNKAVGDQFEPPVHWPFTEAALGQGGGLALGFALSHNTTLTALNLQNVYLGKEGVTEFADALWTNTTLTILNLEGNYMGAEGAAELTHVLNSNTTLTALDISENEVGEIGIHLIADYLAVNTSLKILNWENNESRGDSEEVGRSSPFAWSLVAKSLCSNTSLTALNVGFNELGDAFGMKMAAALRINTALTKLDLSNTGLGLKGGKALAKALCINSTLHHLALGEMEDVRGFGKEMAAALRVNTTLKSLDMRNEMMGMHMGDADVKAIAKVLLTNTSLTSINIPSASCGEDGMRAMAKTLRVNTTLRELILPESRFSGTEHCWPEIVEAWGDRWGMLSNETWGDFNGKLYTGGCTHATSPQRQLDDNVLFEKLERWGEEEGFPNTEPA